MTEYKQNAVSEVVWPWVESREPPSPPNLAQRLASKGLWIEILIMLIAAYLIVYLFVFNFLGHQTAAKIIWGFMTFMVLSAIFLPAVHGKIKAFFFWFGGKVAIGVTWILLVPFYYLCFVPGHLMNKLKGKDPMERKFPTERKSYWIARKPVKNMGQYKKQH